MRQELFDVLYSEVTIKTSGFELISEGGPYNHFTATFRCNQCGHEVGYGRDQMAYGRDLECVNCRQTCSVF